jgi:hypothetical protein
VVALRAGLCSEFLLEACGFQEAGELLLDPAGEVETNPAHWYPTPKVMDPMPEA